MLILTIMFIIIGYLNDKLSHYSDICMWIGLFGGICTGFTTFIMLIIIIINTTIYDGTKNAIDEQYKSLMYKSQTEACRDEFGIVDKEYIDEVQNWNMNVVKYKSYSHNLWIGIFYPNYFDTYKTIDLDSIKLHDK